MHIGLCTLADGKSPVGEVVREAAAAGYDGVEIWGRGHVDGTNGTPDEARRTATGLNLDIPTYGSYLRPGTPEFAESYEAELEIATALDADLVRVWAGNQEYGVHDPGHWRRTVSDLRELATAASERGIGVTVEKHEGTLTDDGAGARRLIEKVDEPNCGLNWQPLFGMTSDAIRAEVEELAPLSNNVHIQAVPKSGVTTRCALADAFFDVEHVVRTFQDADFDGYVDVEFVRDDIDFTRAIDADLDYLRSLAR